MDSPTVTQTEINKWLQYIFGWLSILAILNLIRFYLKIRRVQEPKQAPDIESKSCTPQDILNEYKNNSGHKFLTRSERRFREHQLEKHLKQTWRQQRRRSIGSQTKGTEPVRENPAVEESSRMNRPLRQPFTPQSRISHLQHLSFYKLCIYTALPFLTFSIFCHNLRINLTESVSLEVEEESENVELWELDPV
ncbi:MAG: hypothetical protein Q9175_006900 [Cornicularia normoerica]